MKVLFFTNTFPALSETFVLNQVTGMIDAGYDVKIFAWGIGEKKPHESFKKYNLIEKTWYLDYTIPQNHFKRFAKIVPFLLTLFIKNGFKVLNLISSKYGRGGHNLVHSYIAYRYCQEKSWHPDIIISHFGDNGRIITALRDSGIIDEKVIFFTFFHAHEICRLSDEEVKSQYKVMFNNKDILLPISDLWRRKLLRAGAIATNTKVFRLGVDLNKFEYNPTKKIGNTINILSVGRLVGQKGYEYAIEGVSKYSKKTNKKIIYNIIGKGELEMHLKQLVRNLNSIDIVNFLGAKTQDEVREFLNSCDVFLLPSVTDLEGFMEGIPVALMEAMATGKICISTFHSGIPELIIDGISGYLCKEKDSDEICKKLMKIESLDDISIKKITSEAFNTISSRYNKENEINNLKTLINSI